MHVHVHVHACVLLYSYIFPFKCALYMSSYTCICMILYICMYIVYIFFRIFLYICIHACMVKIPAVVNQYLRDYQQDGVRFLYDHFITNTGAVLCDDMGLGKTVQVIAFMCSILRKTCTRSDVLLTSPKQVHTGTVYTCRSLKLHAYNVLYM